MTNPYLNPETEPSHASPTSQGPHKNQPPTWKKVLAWTSVISGIIFALGGIFGGNSAGYIIGALLFGAAVCAPGLWWMYCEKRDKAAREEAAQHSANYSLLSESDRTLLGDPPTAEKMQRRWPAVALASVVVLFIGAALVPAEETNNEEPKGLTTVEPSESEATATETAAETKKKETTAEKAPEDQPTEQPQEQEPIEQSQVEEPTVQESTIDEAPAYTPDPEPTYEPPAAVPPASVYYSSCAQAKAAGAAPLYAGSPGYSSNLDRDGDGVACEN